MAPNRAFHSAPPHAAPCPVRMARFGRALRALLLFAIALVASCGPGERPLLPRTQTWAELRVIRRPVTVAPAGEDERLPYPRERLADGQSVRVGEGGLCWVRRDGGATLLVRGPAKLVLRTDGIEIAEGRVFVDTPAGASSAGAGALGGAGRTAIATPRGSLHLARVRASIDVSASGATEAYVLAGELRTEEGARATAGERLMIGAGDGAKASVSPVTIWDDWTGGLATTDRAAEPGPYGVGTIGARRPGEQGAPRFPLAIQRLDVRVSIEGDFALTEVDEVFFNPSGETVEGIYRFRTPEGATLHRFGVDRDGAIVWGRVKEKQAAAAQYQANVYQGSTEDPALLEWEGPGVYRARLYPIGPGESRRVVVRYGEWLARTGARGERRLYVYPMAAEAAEGTLPIIEELSVAIDLAKAGATEVRTGMTGVRVGETIVVRAQDLVPRADLAVELFDGGVTNARGYRAPHRVEPETLAPSERAEAARAAMSEPGYLLVPLRAADVPLLKGGLDLAIVVDTSAATDAASLAIARAATAALLAHLGPDDRAIVWGGDDGLRPVVPGWTALAPVDDAKRRDVLVRLAGVARGGATDLGAMLAKAAAGLDPARRGALVYVGDGAPTVGELSLADLRARMAKLPRPVRTFALGVGDSANMALLAGLAKGGFAERVGDANAAARAALRLLESAERATWMGAAIDLGTGVERVFPRELGAMVEGETALVIGRVTGNVPATIAVTGPLGKREIPIAVQSIEDRGDLRRRWAEARLAAMIEEGAGRAAMVDLGARHGIITPFSSLYVPTKNEMTQDERIELERARDRAAELRRQSLASKARVRQPARSSPFSTRSEDDADRGEDLPTASIADNKESGTGTRAKGEEGSMGMRASAAPRPAAPGAAPAQQASTRGPAPSGRTASAAPSVPLTDSESGFLPAAPAAPAASAPPPPGDPMVALAAAAATAAPSAPGGPKGGSAPAEKTTETTAPPPARADAANAALEELSKPLAGGKADAWGTGVGDAFGAGGLGLTGTGEGGGGQSEGIGLGSIGTIGHGTGTGPGFGSGFGRLGGSHRAEPTGNIEQKSEEKSRRTSDRRFAQRAAKDAGGADKLIVVRFGDLPHAPSRCGAAAAVPLEERAALWRERLAAAGGQVNAVASVYRRALAACEAPGWRERARLLSMLLDAMPTVTGRVALWRAMFGDVGAADTLYRGIVARIRTPQEMRELHAALGLRSIDPGLLAKMLADAKTPAARVTKLRTLAVEWPDDFALALRLLDALEDAGDASAARELARKLRGRPDADARVRTAVGELYLRLAAAAATPEEKAADEAEARRAFGEIVEFAPDDPVARRRLGDLLRAHGWYAEAARHYETLARLAPDDPGVPLLLAATAEGRGKLDEAIRWTERGGAAGAPDVAQGPAVTARAFAATYLAWGRAAALEAGRRDEADRLLARRARVLSGEARGGPKAAARATLTWAHPELHPTLWSNALGTPMPAPEGDVTLGIAQVHVPPRADAFVEVRVEPDEAEHAARLRAEAVLTVVIDEGGPDERIVRVPIRFADSPRPVRRFAIAGRDVREVAP